MPLTSLGSFLLAIFAGSFLVGPDLRCALRAISFHKCFEKHNRDIDTGFCSTGERVFAVPTTLAANA
jgi:hypothetical protein